MKRALYTLAFAAATLFTTAAAHAQVGVAVRVGPSAVVYGAPSPGPGYIWAPGYYAGTVWVPGSWVYRSYYRPYYGRTYYAHPYYAHPDYRAHYDRPYGRRR
jgi:hypothetical protein